VPVRGCVIIRPSPLILLRSARVTVSTPGFDKTWDPLPNVRNHMLARGVFHRLFPGTRCG